MLCHSSLVNETWNGCLYDCSERDHHGQQKNICQVINGDEYGGPRSLEGEIYDGDHVWDYAEKDCPCESHQCACRPTGHSCRI